MGPILRFFFCALSWLLAARVLNAQATSGGTEAEADSVRPSIVAGIAVHGNKVTRPEIVLREMTLHVGDTVSQEEIEYSQTRIYSLGLFNRVEIFAPPMDSTILVVEVHERWYVYPVPVLTIVNHDLSKWQYGLGITHQNFRGWNEKLFAGFAAGYNPWWSLSYSTPWVFGDGRYFAGASLRYDRIENKSILSRGDGPNFDERHYSGGGTAGLRMDKFRSVWLNAGYSYVDVTDPAAGRTASPEGIDRFLFAGIGAKHDTRDLAEYPTDGIFGTVSITKKGIGFGAVDFVSYTVDARMYRPVLRKGPSIGVRVFTRLCSGPAIPNYEHAFFGYGERLRGHFSRQVEGDNIAGASVEVRVPVIPAFYVSVPQMPIEQFAVWKFALYAALFADAGTTWYKRQRPEWGNLPSGFGGGIHVLLPYSAVLRFERAWNERGAGEWILDIGASF